MPWAWILATPPFNTIYYPYLELLYDELLEEIDVDEVEEELLTLELTEVEVELLTLEYVE